MTSQVLVDKLRAIARGRETIFYWDIAPFADVDREGPHFAALVGRHLDEANRAEHAAGRPLISAVVIGKESNMPGVGFFNCARTGCVRRKRRCQILARGIGPSPRLLG